MSKIDRINERERRRQEIEAVFEDYRKSVLDYAEWMEDFRKRTGRMHPFLPLSHETETGEAA